MCELMASGKLKVQEYAQRYSILLFSITSEVHISDWKVHKISTHWRKYGKKMVASTKILTAKKYIPKEKDYLNNNS